ncbi:MAG: polymerase delta prime subunit [Cyanobacteria bacterium RYN_339]|nr:polymerase delta prime subunit [Cyanobacteria bacterium RYN_339]
MACNSGAATGSSLHPLDSLAGQPQASSRLTRALLRPSHAYLFVGPTGVGKRTAAMLFARALICDQRGCGTCATCRMVLGGGHPDVRVWDVPEGEKTFKIEIVRELVSAVQRRPFQAERQVHILAALDQTQPAGANALLKTLEEPPSSTTLILLARELENVLPTLVSRSQVVTFGLTPPEAIEAHLRAALGLDATRARLIAHQAEGRLGRAITAATEPPAPPPLIELPPGPGLEAIAWADKLAALPGPDQQLHLAAMLTWLRDAAWLAAGGNAERVVRADDMARLHGAAAARPAEQWVRLAEAVEAAREQLERHANAKLVLDHLARELVGR